MSDKKEIDQFSGVETTGHSWDGIKELNNPMPRWWLWCFYATIVFAIGYSIAYPSWPGLTTSTKGYLGWTSRGDLANSIEEAKSAQSVYLNKLISSNLSEIQKDPDLNQFAIAGGNAAFKVNCVQCHGSGAAGFPGYPNLNDDDWIWGGSIEEIHTTLEHGIRHAQDEDTRFSDMPAYGRDEIFDKSQISDVAWFVRKISDQETDLVAANRGEQIYIDNCVACHGENGEGIREVGGPRLSDAIWLYGGDHKDIMAQIHTPKQGVMPAWGNRLDNATVKQLSLFVYSLGGGE